MQLLKRRSTAGPFDRAGSGAGTGAPPPGDGGVALIPGDAYQVWVQTAVAWPMTMLTV